MEERLPKHQSSVNEELELPLQLSDCFSSSFCWAQEPLSKPLPLQLSTSKANGATDALSQFSPVEGKSSSREHSNPLPTQRPSAPKFCPQNARLPSAISALRCAPSTRHQDDSRTRCARPSSHISILEIHSKRKRPSPGLMG